MFTLDDMKALLTAQPFAPFRIHMSDGGSIEVRHPELVMTGRRYAVIGLPSPDAPDSAFDRHTVAWYMHVTCTEMLNVGQAPMSPGSPPDSGRPSSVK